MDAVDDKTPTPPESLPRAGSSNGIPEPIEEETTGKLVSALFAAGASEELLNSFVKKAADAIVASNAESGNGGGDNGAKYVKEIKRSKWLVALLALVFGSGGMVGTFYALKARAENNTQEVEALKVADKAAKPLIQKNTDDIKLIQADVSKFNTTVGELKTQNTNIAAGVESLKQVNVDKLEKENEKLEQELRRLRNR